MSIAVIRNSFFRNPLESKKRERREFSQLQLMTYYKVERASQLCSIRIYSTPFENKSFY
jgi:hypothetical protein